MPSLQARTRDSLVSLASRTFSCSTLERSRCSSTSRSRACWALAWGREEGSLTAPNPHCKPTHLLLLQHPLGLLNGPTASCEPSQRGDGEGTEEVTDLFLEGEDSLWCRVTARPGERGVSARNKGGVASPSGGGDSQRSAHDT